MTSKTNNAKEATMTRTARVSTRGYRRSHLNEPKGRGYWLFAFDGDEDPDNLWGTNGTYTEARKAAKAEAKTRGAELVEVMP